MQTNQNIHDFLKIIQTKNSLLSHEDKNSTFEVKEYYCSTFIHKKISWSRENTIIETNPEGLSLS